jgi:hypothetical protein
VIVRLTRWLYTPRSVVSDVVVDENLHFYGLEDLQDRPIPPGDYKLLVTRSPKVEAGSLWSPDPPWLPLILPTPGREGIRIHAGNTADDVEGCIALGMSFGDGNVLRSRVAVTTFMKYLWGQDGLAKIHSLLIRTSSQGA